MELRIIARHLEVPGSIRDFARHRAGFALGRFEPRIARITVRLSDVNGPRGGLDKRCEIEAKLRPKGNVVVDVNDSDLEHAVGRAIQRLARAVQAYLERLRATQRSRLGRRGRSSQ